MLHIRSTFRLKLRVGVSIWDKRKTTSITRYIACGSWAYRRWCRKAMHCPKESHDFSGFIVQRHQYRVFEFSFHVLVFFNHCSVWKFAFFIFCFICVVLLGISSFITSSKYTLSNKLQEVHHGIQGIAW